MPSVPTADLWQETPGRLPTSRRGEAGQTASDQISLSLDTRAGQPPRGYCDLGIDERLDACKMRRSGMKW